MKYQMRRSLSVLILLVLLLYLPSEVTAQSVPSEAEVQEFFNNQNILITYREGEALYGTYYFLEIHYCPNGYYGLYGSTVKRTVLDNEQRSNWQEFGNWQAMSQNGQVGLYYADTNGNQQFVPLYKLPNGDMFIGEGISIVKQGQAICN